MPISEALIKLLQENSPTTSTWQNINITADAESPTRVEIEALANAIEQNTTVRTLALTLTNISQLSPDNFRILMQGFSRNQHINTFIFYEFDCANLSNAQFETWLDLLRTQNSYRTIQMSNVFERLSPDRQLALRDVLNGKPLVKVQCLQYTESKPEPFIEQLAVKASIKQTTRLELMVPEAIIVDEMQLANVAKLVSTMPAIESILIRQSDLSKAPIASVITFMRTLASSPACRLSIYRSVISLHLRCQN